MCVLLITGLFVRRELFSDRAAKATKQEFTDLSEPAWAEVQEGGRIISRANGPVKIVVFADFQCPACRHFALTSLRPIMKQYEGRVAVSFKHWPLSYHEQAYPAARASECAGSQGRFVEMHDLMFEKQDSLALISFPAFARRAMVPDVPAFEACMADQAPMPNIDRSRALAEKYEFTGTPTIVIDGRVLSSVPDSARFARLLDDMD
jgi:protein-disulfide isomerase